MSFEENLFKSIRTVIKNMRKILDKEIVLYGISHAEMRLLMILYSAGNCTQEELTSKIEVDRSNIGRSLNKLLRLGYVNKIRDTDDKRMNRVYLTKKGMAIKDELIKIKTDIEKTIAAEVSEEEMRIIINLLDKINKGIIEDNYSRIKSSSN